MNRFKRSYDIHVSKQHGIILLLHIPVNNRTQGPKSNISSNNNNNTNLRCVSVIWILRHECLLRAERQCGEGGKHENEHINTESTYTMFCRWNIVWQTLRNHSNNERNGMKNPQTFVETNEKRLTTFISGKLLGDLLLCRWNIWAKPSEKWESGWMSQRHREQKKCFFCYIIYILFTVNSCHLQRMQRKQKAIVSQWCIRFEYMPLYLFWNCIAKEVTISFSWSWLSFSSPLSQTLAHILTHHFFLQCTNDGFARYTKWFRAKRHLFGISN